MPADAAPLKLLFVCSMNQWRSPTAELLFRGFNGCQTRSAGTADGARIKIDAGLIGWSDLIFTMEKKHVRQIEEAFGEALLNKRVICLHIPDSYRRDDPELIELLKASVIPHLVGSE